MIDPRYPIGPFEPPESVSPEQRRSLIGDVAGLPRQVRAAVADLGAARLDTPYREGGWTARQVVHHIADSHINAYVRFRLALTEATPTIRPYAEALWADLPDAHSGEVDLSLALIEALHKRWVVLLESMTEEQWRRDYFHPEAGNTMLLSTVLAMYSWHGRHHLAHIKRVSEAGGAGS